MPESYGKRQRSVVKARKADKREERRKARLQRRNDPGADSMFVSEEPTAPEDVESAPAAVEEIQAPH